MDKKFESSVNSEGIETFASVTQSINLFESSVNSEGIETDGKGFLVMQLFESSVNSEGIETTLSKCSGISGLRAV